MPCMAQKKSTGETAVLHAKSKMALASGLLLAGTAHGQPAPEPAVSSSAASAQPQDGKELPTVTVIASDPSPASPQTTPYATQYNQVTEEQIRAQGGKDFLSTMRNVPGVIFQSKNLLGSQTSHSLYVRGRGASHPSSDLTIEFDGVPRYGALYGQTLADSIAVSTIGGMNIYKSPQPSQFGSGYAMISVTPKFMQEPGKAAEFSLSAGSYGTFLESLSAGTKQGRLDIYASQSWSSTDGHRDHSRAQQQNYYLNTGIAFNEHWNMRLLANHVESQTLAPWPAHTGPGISWPMAERFDTETDFLTLTLNHRYDQAEGYLKLYRNDTAFDLLEQLNASGIRQGASSRQDVELYGVRGRERLYPWQGGEILLGVDVDRSALKNTERNYTTHVTRVWDFPDTTMVSPYFAISQTFGTAKAFHVTPSAGVRYFDHNEFGSATAPQAGLVVGHDGTELNLSYAKGVNYPSVVALQGLLQSGGSGLWGALEPEVVNHYEIGLAQKWDSAQIHATAFRDRGKNRFRVWFFNPGNPVFNDPDNRYTIRGLELSTTVSLTPALKVFGGATWLDVKTTDAGGVTQNKMPYTPDFTLQAGLTWDFLPSSRLTFDIQRLEELYQGTSMRTSGAFPALTRADRLGNITLANLRVSHMLDDGSFGMKGAEVFVSVDNLFDRNYEYAKGYAMPGLTAMAGFTIRFK